MASSLSKSVECQKSVLRYLDTIINGFISLSVSNLHFSLLCSVSVKAAEEYVVASVDDGSLGCDVRKKGFKIYFNRFFRLFF